VAGDRAFARTSSSTVEGVDTSIICGCAATNPLQPTLTDMVAGGMRRSCLMTSRTEEYVTTDATFPLRSLVACELAKATYRASGANSVANVLDRLRRSPGVGSSCVTNTHSFERGGIALARRFVSSLS